MPTQPMATFSVRPIPAPTGRALKVLWAVGYLILQVTLLGTLFILYRLGRHLADGHTTMALHHARDVWDFERFIDLPSEAWVQAQALHWTELIRIANRFYITVHFPAAIALLLWVMVFHRDAWPRVRAVIIMATGVALCIHILYPLAPPRFLHNGMVDTGAVYGPSPYSDPGVNSVANQYAAMPSLHIGWAILEAWAVIRILRTRWRWLAIVVVITANHYWSDGIVGGLLVGMAIWITDPTRGRWVGLPRAAGHPDAIPRPRPAGRSDWPERLGLAGSASAVLPAVTGPFLPPMVPRARTATPGRTRVPGVASGRLGSWPTPLANVLDLDDPAARRPGVVGTKAAALALARAGRVPVPPGFVITPAGAASFTEGATPVAAQALADLRDAARRLTAAVPGLVGFVVRASSPPEVARQPATGRRRSIVGVRAADLGAAVREVVASAHGAPMAVLVQPQLPSRATGTLFAAAVRRPHSRALVLSARQTPVSPAVPAPATDRSETADAGRPGATVVISRRGRTLGGRPDWMPGELPVALTHLARRTARVSGGPRDLEWAVDPVGGMWLLQAGPAGDAPPVAAPGARLLGPGPFARIFPAPLAPLEQDLWVPPLADGLSSALTLLEGVPRRQLRGHPPVTVVNGRVVADLEMLGLVAPRGIRRRLSPLPPARRLLAAGRVRTLRRAAPRLTAELTDQIDERLAQIPELSTLSTAQLVDVLERTRMALTTVSGYEAAARILNRRACPSTRPTIILGARRPSFGPRIPGRIGAGRIGAGRWSGECLGEPAGAGPARRVLDGPPVSVAAPTAPSPHGVPDIREHGGPGLGAGLVTALALADRGAAMRDLTSRVVAELGRRLAAAGLLPDPEAVLRLGLADLRRAVVLDERDVRPGDDGAPGPVGADPLAASGPWAPALPRTREIHERTAFGPRDGGPAVRPSGDATEPLRPGEPGSVDGAALPYAFRLSADGRVVPDRACSRIGTFIGTPVGGGLGAGDAIHGDDLVPADEPTGALVVNGQTGEPEAAGWPEGPGTPDAPSGSEGTIDAGGPAAGRVLVTATLDARLTSLLPGLAGLVSETGSPRAPLAQAAREQGIPTVVGVTHARQRLPPGAHVVVDGAAGPVGRIPDSPAPRTTRN
ncbi:MAG: phosphatase PAP2 family protein [Frankia sp.]